MSLLESINELLMTNEKIPPKLKAERRDCTAKFSWMNSKICLLFICTFLSWRK